MYSIQYYKSLKKHEKEPEYLPYKGSNGRKKAYVSRCAQYGRKSAQMPH